ncbi:MAG: hypothetical protein KBE79_00045 [Sulfurospirillum sp.]|jgi:predicted AAA+ superfamily ATPase|nr:hypothetical protein [Sulfurospirillum sp.]MBP9491577.1 hypothetical protein [Sulfurospirillum sp.]MBP9612312.1 hypothetical protein [Sulfurospirillum sp.]
MIQFLILITFLAIFGTVFYAKSETLSKKSKIILFVSVGILIAFGWLYELNSSQKSQNNREVLSAFKQGKIITCNDIDVSNKEFIYVSGTLSFMPNDTNQNHKGLVIDIVTCKLK